MAEKQHFNVAKKNGNDQFSSDRQTRIRDFENRLHQVKVKIERIEAKQKEQKVKNKIARLY